MLTMVPLTTISLSIVQQKLNAATQTKIVYKGFCTTMSFSPLSFSGNSAILIPIFFFIWLLKLYGTGYNF